MPKYHEWMKDPALLEATASEPLSFEEEMEMQQSWMEDPEKCTFIVHATDDCQALDSLPVFSVRENLKGMVGDVNLFLSDIEEEDENEKSSSGTSRIQAEVDIMIAEKDYRQKGLGRAATSAMLIYGADTLKVNRFFCKINEDNKASIKLFESLGFVQCDYAACFKQIEFELVKPPSELKESLELYGSYQTLACPTNDA